MSDIRTELDDLRVHAKRYHDEAVAGAKAMPTDLDIVARVHGSREHELLADLNSMGRRLRRADPHDFEQLAQQLTAMALRVCRSAAEAQVLDVARPSEGSHV